MWFTDAPDLLQRELGALEEAGIEYALDDALREEEGIIRLTAQVPIADQTHDFVATYPDDFPYFKPFVTGPDLGYGHHFSPTTGEYCLLETGRGAWGVGDTLAWLLTEQMSKLVALNVGSSEPMPDLEVPQAEPFTAYLTPKNLGEVFIVDSVLQPGAHRHGSALLVYTSGMDAGTPLRGHVHLLRDAAGTQIAAAPEAPVRADHRIGEVNIEWVQLESEPRVNSPQAWWAAAQEVSETVSRARQGYPGKVANNHSRAMQIVLVGFPEETGHRTPGQGWVGLIRHREQAKKPWGAPRFVRVERAGHGDLYVREPRLSSMRDARIAVVGLGGIGAHLVPLLGCTAPAQMWLVDGDHSTAATAIRNPGAFATTGSSKAELGLRVVHATQPYTRVNATGLRVGAPRQPQAERSRAGADDSISDIVANVDLVVDAAADLSVQHFLSDVARRHGVAYLRAEALPGVRSGFVALQRPDADVCWMCWQHHLATTIAPLPQYEPEGGVQPPGCPDPTYTGAGFDLAAIAAQTAQLAASYLTGAGGYGQLPADVMTVQFVDDEGRPTPATWQPHDLPRHPECRNHQDQPSS